MSKIKGKPAVCIISARTDQEIADARALLSGHLFYTHTAPSEIDVIKLVIRVRPGYFDSPIQEANGRAICACGGVGRTRKLCLGCEREGWKLIVERKAARS